MLILHRTTVVAQGAQCPEQREDIVVRLQALHPSRYLPHYAASVVATARFCDHTGHYDLGKDAWNTNRAQLQHDENEIRVVEGNSEQNPHKAPQP